MDQALSWMRVRDEPTPVAAGTSAAGRATTRIPSRILRTGQPERRCVVLDLAPTSPMGLRLAEALTAACDRELGFAGRHEAFTSQVAESAAIVVACDSPDDLVARIAGWRIASPQLAVIVALEQVNGSMLRALVAAGICDFVVAPFDAQQLRARIDAAIARAMTDTVRGQTSEWPLLVGSTMACEESFRQIKSRIVASFERGYIEGLLRRSAGNISQSARMARKNRRAFFELIRKHDIDVTGFREAELPAAEGAPGRR
ncbi:hypothetical protein [Derxia gummosa]|uniref:Response regulator n=1 Tax=Derxia gummosa DSM 723 TaxID=1121388 RepID=A0A8B6XCJ8_9BURK|nr:hypothetical protein [Derxia gummosa]